MNPASRLLHRQIAWFLLGQYGLFLILSAGHLHLPSSHSDSPSEITDRCCDHPHYTQDNHCLICHVVQIINASWFQSLPHSQGILQSSWIVTNDPFDDQIPYSSHDSRAPPMV
ncbi:MAG: hypothetical protein RBU29_12920 [bacterium]|nr:hypothetical protein [bacterium]